MNESLGLTSFKHQADMLANRVKKRFSHFYKRFSRQQIDVFRLYDWDIPEIRAVVDWYGGHLVVGEYMRRQSVPEWLPAMGQAVAEVLGVPPERLHLKQRWAGPRDGKRYERIDYTDQKIVLRERDLRFWVNPHDYVDTGLFADHRNTRQMVRDMAAGKDVLNLFGYTASFSCYAAKGGARRTVSVDRSETATRWAAENFSLNTIDPAENRLVHSHTADYLQRARREGQRFDLAVVDPPSYSVTQTRNESFDIFKDHPRLLAAVITLLRPSATLFFSTNHQRFTFDQDGLIRCLADFPESAPTISKVEEITQRTIPEDYQHKRKTIHRCWQITV
ncbi:class I SAM-dependent methyltransferase [Desulfosarcina sp. OttesenSCG-928-A07]|nr:class I SAM-dependent methyltransferase [Desulfosarcina sp. OttesenSCG-928-G17]MDL2328134.1 class I SAM-dependent methyltransferase [Desulfosarcina sp. OttesenSCG-928-A07]